MTDDTLSKNFDCLKKANPKLLCCFCQQGSEANHINGTMLNLPNGSRAHRGCLELSGLTWLVRQFRTPEGEVKATTPQATIESLKQGLERIINLLKSPNINTETARFVAEKYLEEGTCFITGWEHERMGIPRDAYQNDLESDQEGT